MPRYARINVMRQKSHKKTRSDYPPLRYDPWQSILAVMTPRRIERFWARVDQAGGPNACWPWCGSPGSQGYGLLQGATNYRGFSFLAHRIAFALYNQRDPLIGLLVRHSCDNPPCCNPAHLIEGTQKDNYDDAVERGRMPHRDDPFLARGKHGVEANAARYTLEQRDRAIALRYEERRTIADIARATGAHRTTIMRWLAEHQATLCPE